MGERWGEEDEERLRTVAESHHVSGLNKQSRSNLFSNLRCKPCLKPHSTDEKTEAKKLPNVTQLERSEARFLSLNSPPHLQPLRLEEVIEIISQITAI